MMVCFLYSKKMCVDSVFRNSRVAINRILAGQGLRDDIVNRNSRPNRCNVTPEFVEVRRW